MLKSLSIKTHYMCFKLIKLEFHFIGWFQKFTLILLLIGFGQENFSSITTFPLCYPLDLLKFLMS